MKYFLRGALLVLATAMAAIFIAGCAGDKQEADFHVYLKEAKGLTAQCAVRWRGVDIGHVTTVGAENDRIRVEVLLDDAYHDRLREGAKAKAVKGLLGQSETVLEVFGGADTLLPPLVRGSEIPEAGFMDGIPHSTWLIVGGVILAIVLFWLLLKGIKRIIALLLAFAFLVASLGLLGYQLNKHRTELLGSETEAELSELADNILESDEAKAVWDSMKTEIANALAEAKKHGASAVQHAKDKVGGVLEEKVAELEKDGKKVVAENIMTLKDHVVDYLEKQDKSSGSREQVNTD